MTPGRFSFYCNFTAIVDRANFPVGGFRGTAIKAESSVVHTSTVFYFVKICLLYNSRVEN